MSKLRYLLEARTSLKPISHFVSLLPNRCVYSIIVGRLVDTMFAEEVMLTFSKCLWAMFIFPATEVCWLVYFCLGQQGLKRPGWENTIHRHLLQEAN